MTEQQIQMIQKSFQIIIEQKDRLAETFLTGLRRSLKKELWPADPIWFCRYVMQTVAVCVRGVSRWDQLAPMLRDVGQTYLKGRMSGVNTDLVRTAFLGGIQECLGRQYTPELGRVWTMWYDMVSTQILEGSGEMPARKVSRSVSSLVKRMHFN